MCGICGIFYRNGRPADFSQLDRMTMVMAHRGPDDYGYFLGENVGLGFRRLSIIDLEGGRQPMPNEDGSVQVVFNGEIYNYRDLRAELKFMGHDFKTSSDTEVLVHGYESWGEDVVTHLNGMFGFAVWDSRNRKLMLARDRLGIKPLFYLLRDDVLAFASEIKSLLLVPGEQPEVNERAVFDYFSHLYIPAPNTIYQDIFKLRPGEILVAQGRDIRRRKYWHPLNMGLIDRPLNDLCDELRERIVESTRMQLVSDVPLGIFLSGGVDSSAIAAAAAHAGASEIPTFSVGFDVAKYDELPYAREVSRHLRGTNHSFTLSAAPMELLSRLIWHLDEPMADATILPTYLLSRFTREKVKVVLSGEGGDELFGGYTHYQGMRINQWLQAIPAPLRRTQASLIGKLPNFGSSQFGYFRHRMERILNSSLFSPYDDYCNKVSIFSRDGLDQLFSPEFRQRTADFPYLEALHAVPPSAPKLDPISQASLADLTVYLPEVMLNRADRMSMACSLEIRVPLLNHTLVEFAFALPLNLKLKGLQTKYLLKESLKPWLPESILHRKKRGFNPPLEFWLQRKIEAYVKQYGIIGILQDSGYFNIGHIEKMISDHIRSRYDYSRQIWALLVFAIWWKHVRGRGEEPLL
ncbi:MAG: asparagine synthase (glutamine-hydrolyzing) [Desulfobacteraceae bacterium]|nr:asparagine synthase (glutamine-hydrolyzing) [Desulfobacteraceae bacterium]